MKILLLIAATPCLKNNRIYIKLLFPPQHLFDITAWLNVIAASGTKGPRKEYTPRKKNLFDCLKEQKTIQSQVWRTGHMAARNNGSHLLIYHHRCIVWRMLMKVKWHAGALFGFIRAFGLRTQTLVKNSFSPVPLCDWETFTAHTVSCSVLDNARVKSSHLISLFGPHPSLEQIKRAWFAGVQASQAVLQSI